LGFSIVFVEATAAILLYIRYERKIKVRNTMVHIP
jgi:hypothetical protein